MDFEKLKVTPKVSAHDAIAIVGVGAILPDALSAAQFWENVLSGRYSIREVPPWRWKIEDYYDPDPEVPDKTYCKIGAFVEGFKFDSMKFRIPPKTANAMDLVQQWAIAATLEALSDAGLKEGDSGREKTAVIFGNALLEESINLTNLRVNLPIYIEALLNNSDFRSLPDEKQKAILSGFTEEIKKISPVITEDTMPGELSNVISGRVANVFNFKGANFTTDAACASSLAAFSVAVGGLRNEEFDIAIAGGVDRSMSPSTYIKFCKIGALSPDGSYPFDERAGGFVMGEGCACFVLKRLSDAYRAGDRIYAVILGGGSSSDGKGKGITAPNMEGQVLALKRAYESTGVDPETVAFIEAHGTATRVGDVVEVQSLGKLFEGQKRKRPLFLTSVKSQIGHLKAAAGAASMLKVAFALKNKIMPVSINFEKPNLGIDWNGLNIRVLKENVPWDGGDGYPFTAGVSSFGFGGTNFHFVVQEALMPEELSGRLKEKNETGSFSGGEQRKIVVMTEEKETIAYSRNMGGGEKIIEKGEREMMEGNVVTDVLARIGFFYGDTFEEIFNSIASGAKLERFTTLADVARMREKKWRLAIVGENEEAFDSKITRLKGAIKNELDSSTIRFLRRQGIFISGRLLSGIGFMYPGQGSQSVNMLSFFRERYSVFREVIDVADSVMEPIIGCKLSEVIYTTAKPDSKEFEQLEERLKKTEITQPAMLTMNYAMTKILSELGIGCDFVTGHSLGEYSALVSAGVLRFEDALEIVAARGREMTSVSLEDPGMMFAAMADPETTEKLLKKIDGYLVPANKNSPRQTVVAGNTEAVQRAMKIFEEEGIRTVPLRVSHAFHSKIVAPATEPLKKVLSRYEFSRSSVPVFGNVSGEPYPENATKEHFIEILGKQIASPVEFIKCIQNMRKAGAGFFVEVGPKRVLASFAEDILSGEDVVVMCSNNHKQSDIESLAYLFACASVEGVIQHEGSRIGSGGKTESSLEKNEKNQRSVEMKQGISKEKILEEIIAIVSEKTGYPVDILDPSMDMEADLGIDTVKQAELFSIVRKKYGIPRQENLKLKDYPTIKHVAEFVAGFVCGTDTETENKEGRKLEEEEVEEKVAKDLGGELELEKPEDIRGREIEVISSDRIKIKEGGAEGAGDEIVISGSALGLPGATRQVFGDSNFEDIFEGKNFIDRLDSEVQKKFLELNIMRIDKGNGDDFNQRVVDSLEDVIKLAGQMGRIDARADYGIDRDFLDSMDDTALLGISAGFEALRDAGIPLVLQKKKTTIGSEIPHGWYLPEEMRDETGIIFASAFPGYNRFARELSRYFEHKYEGKPYEFDRKILFGILAMGHSQFAQLIKARGPNIHLNCACASGLIALATAADWIKCGRCKRVIVISADNTTSDAMLPWIGGGFLASGGAATDEDVRNAAIPFGRNRHGLLLGMGASAFVVETKEKVLERGMCGLAKVVDTHVCNSAFHGSRLDVEHISEVMKDFVQRCANKTGLSLEELAEGLVFFSHETYTPARGGSAGAEVNALRNAFGKYVPKIVVTNTKGFTGHPMGVGIEEAVASKVVFEGKVPPVANLNDIDPEFMDLNFSRGGRFDVKRVLRFAAGFGSQVAMALLQRDGNSKERIIDDNLHNAYLQRITQSPKPRLFFEGRVLKVDVEKEFTGEAKDDVATRVPIPERQIDIGQIRSEIISLISEKTGYPLEVLDPDMDMEADLGIDTVKQAEIISLVRKKYNLKKVENLRLKDYPTINKIVDFVASLMKNEENYQKGDQTTAAQISVPPEEKIDETIYKPSDISGIKIRKTIQKCFPPSVAFGPTNINLSSGMAVVLHGFSDLREGVEDEFSKRGIKIINGDTLLEDSSATNSLQSDTKICGIIFFDDRKISGLPSLEDLPFHCKLITNESVKRISVLQKVISSKKFDDRNGFILGITIGGKMFTNSNLRGSLSSGAMSGFVKALSFEFPDCLVKSIDISPDMDVKDAVKSVFDEILFDRGTREAGICEGGRWIIDLESVGLPDVLQETDKPLQRKVIMVTGAGGSVMRDVVRKLAVNGSNDFVLIDVVRPIAEQGGVKWSENFSRIMRLIEFVERKGCSAFYAVADVTDTESIEKAVNSAILKFGRIDVVIHGAGMERSRSAAKKQIDEFRLVSSIKIEGCGNIVSAVMKNCKPMKFIFFSSVAGRFGNAGQTDYSAGNDFMAGLAHIYGAQFSDVKFVTIDWTAWDGEGMAGSEAIRAVLEDAGVEFLPRREGLEVLSRIVNGDVTYPELVVSRSLGSLEEMYYKNKKDPAIVSYPWKESWDIEGGKFTRKFLLDPLKDVYLEDHCIEGTPVLPGVKGLELFSVSAKEFLSDGWYLAGIKNVSFQKAIKFFSRKPREVFVTGNMQKSGRNLVVNFKLETEERGPLKAGSMMTNFTATFIYEKSNGNGKGFRNIFTSVDSLEAYGVKSDEGTKIADDEIYRFLFHGPSFRVLNEFCLTNNRDNYGLGKHSNLNVKYLSGIYRAIEFGMQTAGMYLMRCEGIAGLPFSIKSVQIFHEPSQDDIYRAIAIFREGVKEVEGNSLYTFDVSIRDSMGNSIIEINGLSLIETGNVAGVKISGKSLPQKFFSQHSDRDAVSLMGRE